MESCVCPALDLNALHRDTIEVQVSLVIPSGHDVYSVPPSRDFSAAGYRQLAEFRYRIRQFLHLSEEAARSKGINRNSARSSWP